MPVDPDREHQHDVRNALAALLANAQLLESTFAGESPESPFLAEESRESREQALITVRNVVEASDRLAALLTAKR